MIGKTPFYYSRFRKFNLVVYELLSMRKLDKKKLQNICHCHRLLTTYWLSAIYFFVMVTDDLETGLRPHKNSVFFGKRHPRWRIAYIKKTDVGVGDSKNRLSPICHHDNALILNNLNINGDR